MSSPEALNTVVEFSELPDTEEKKEIDRQYLSDEISNFEFFCLADRYLKKTKPATV